MSVRAVLCSLLFIPPTLAAQERTPPDSVRTHNDSLMHHAQTVQSITVTAAPTRPQVPLSVVRITPAVIAATPSTSPWDLLRQVAGIEVHQQGQGPGFASNASIRGFSSDHSTDIALWIDGVPVNEPVNGHAEGYNDWSLLMPQAIRSMEVLKGPTSAVYGNFAMAGVVNVLTRERMTGEEFAVDGGANGRVDGTFFTGLDRSGTGLVIGARGMRDGGWRKNSEQHLGQFYGRLVQQLSPTTTIDIGTQLYAAGWDSPGFLTVDQYDAKAYDNVSDVTDGGFKRHGLERVSLRVVAGSNMFWRTTAYSTQGNWNFFLTIPAEPGAGEGSGGQTQEIDRRTGWGATSALTWAKDRVEITAGAEGRYDNADFQRWFATGARQDSAETQLRARQTSGALFFQSTADVGHHVRFTAGGRYDAVTTRSTPFGKAASRASHGVFSPKLGALIHLPRVGELYVNVSRGFRSSDGVVEDPTLPFITEWAYEGGLHIDNGAVRGSVALFQTDVSNEQSFNPILLTSTNGGRSRRQGVDFSVEAPLGEYARLSGNWTFTKANYLDQNNAAGESLAGMPVANTAKYVGAIAVDLGKRSALWSVRASANVVGEYTPFDEPGVTLPAYGLAHVSGRYIIGGNTTLRLGVRNLFNTRYPEIIAGGFVSPGQTRAVYGGVSYVM